MKKWMYWVKEFKIAWVGNNKKAGQFSHYQAADMSAAEQINSKILLLDKIKANCDAFAGFYQSRLGNTSQENTASQSQMSVSNSVNQTEYYFWKHTNLIQRVLTQAINIRKKILPDDTAYFHSMYSDMEQRYISTEGKKIRDADLGVVVTHGVKSITRREAVRQMAISASGKTGESQDMAALILAETENEIKKILRTITRKSNERYQQEQQAAQQAHQAEMEQKEKDRAWEKEKHYSNLDSQERQEWIRSFINQENNAIDNDNNKIPDALEYETHFEKVNDNMRKHQRELNKQNNDARLKDKELSIKEKEVKVKQDANRIEEKNQANDLAIARQNAKNRGGGSR
jgi:hypothetical protein